MRQALELIGLALIGAGIYLLAGLAWTFVFGGIAVAAVAIGLDSGEAE